MTDRNVIVLNDIPYYDNMCGRELSQTAKRGDTLNILNEVFCHEGKTWFETINGWLMGITSDKKCFIYKNYI